MYIFILFYIGRNYPDLQFQTALEDKCAKAAEIFQCGLAKDSSLISELIVDFKTPDSGVPVRH
jgi:hypothetical protein